MVKRHRVKISFVAFALLIITSLTFFGSAFADTGQNFVILGGSNTKEVETPKDVAAMACIVVKLALDFIPYLVLIAVTAFIQGLVKYVGHGDDEEKRSEGVKMMIYGSLGFFFMVSVWGILKLSGAGLGVDVVIPQFKSSGPGFAQTCK